VNAINLHLPTGAIGAHAADASTVEVQTVPGCDPIALIAQIQNLDVNPDVPAKVVIDERTGTVVLGGDVTLSPCAIAHGNLTVQVEDETKVSQPNPDSKGGSTVVVPHANVQVTEDEQHLINVPESPTISKVVKALNALGVTPRDLISILQAMKEAGALHADVEIQ
jgi:flagellar P-ring protein precursor FlgI